MSRFISLLYIMAFIFSMNANAKQGPAIIIKNGVPITSDTCERLGGEAFLSLSNNVSGAYKCYRGTNAGLILVDACHKGGSVKTVKMKCQIIATARFRDVVSKKQKDPTNPKRQIITTTPVDKQMNIWNGDKSLDIQDDAATGAKGKAGECEESLTDPTKGTFNFVGRRMWTTSNNGGQGAAPIAAAECDDTNLKDTIEWDFDSDI